MGAPKGNKFWRLRKDLTETGKKLTPTQILEKAQEYVDYCIENPLLSGDYKGKDAHYVQMPKMRAMTLQGLWHWIDISPGTWDNWKKDKKYLRVITRVENLFYVHKFEGAAAGLLNHNIIARDLRLADRRDLTSGDKPLEAAERMIIVNSADGNKV